jgi:hypothetical protein
VETLRIAEGECIETDWEIHGSSPFVPVRHTG